MEKISLQSQKQTFLYIFLILVVALMVLPFMTTFNDILTRLVMKLDAYKIIQEFVIPWEVRMVGVILWPFGFQPAVVGDYLAIGGGPSTPFGRSGQSQFLIEIAWNCIGWQSLLFFILTGWIGFQGDRYTNISKIKAWMIGLIGTFLINLVRIVVVVLAAYYFGQNVAIIIHDYGSTLAVVGWLFGYWWFVYSFVLEDRESTVKNVEATP